jgi:putative hydrolase of the HAD superfamily
MTAVTHLFFDIGGVLGTNGWDREQRRAVAARFALDDEFESRHGEVVAEWEIGRLSMDEYLDFTVFHCPRPFTRDEFRAAILDQSRPFPESIAAVTAVRAAGRARLFTLNNESEALNVHRIGGFGLRPLFDGFLTSCWLGLRKPAPLIFERALGIAQAQAAATLFVDDREQNLVPARRLGLQVHHFDGSVPRLRDALRSAGAL